MIALAWIVPIIGAIAALIVRRSKAAPSQTPIVPAQKSGIQTAPNFSAKAGQLLLKRRQYYSLTPLEQERVQYAQQVMDRSRRLYYMLRFAYIAMPKAADVSVGGAIVGGTAEKEITNWILNFLSQQGTIDIWRDPRMLAGSLERHVAEFERGASRWWGITLPKGDPLTWGLPFRWDQHQQWINLESHARAYIAGDEAKPDSVEALASSLRTYFDAAYAATVFGAVVMAVLDIIQSIVKKEEPQPMIPITAVWTALGLFLSWFNITMREAHRAAQLMPQ